MLFSSTRDARVLVAFAIVSFFFITLFGIFYFLIPHTANGESPCPSLPGMSMCAMSPVEHVAFMQDTLTSVHQQMNLTLSLLASVLFFALIRVAWFKRFSYSLLDPQRSLAYFYYKRHVLEGTVLQGLFSNGILNPKLF